MNADRSGTSKNFGNLVFEAGRVFTPGSPLNERELFAGRSEQIDKLIGAISQKGYHAVLYGDRGVGKTSLSNVLIDYIDDLGIQVLMPRTTCDASDDFNSLWKKALKDIEISKVSPSFGFVATDSKTSRSFTDLLPEKVKPDDIRRALQALAENEIIVVIFDEFDRLKSKVTTTLMADTIKSLSDSGVDATILLIGVADSVDELIQEHNSVERALVQVHLPRMSRSEVAEIVRKGLARLGMTIEADALRETAALSQGLPYVTHLISLHAARKALENESLVVKLVHVRQSLHQSLNQWQQSVITTYHEAIRSHQPGNIFREVLAACALADPDELGFFTAASIRAPLRNITGRSYDIPNFARHLNEFTKPERGPVLQRTGETRRVRYRFVSPLIRPYVITRSVADGLLNSDVFGNLDPL